MDISVNVTSKVAETQGAPVMVCGNSDYNIIFTFDAEWEGLDPKLARFVFASEGELKYIDVPFEGNTAPAPVLSNVNEVYIGVYAGKLHTTTPARVYCKKSILCGDPVAVEPDPSLYGPILDIINEVIDARTSSLSGTVFPSLSQRLAADFNTCVTQGELEKALGNVTKNYQAADAELEERLTQNEADIKNLQVSNDSIQEVIDARTSSLSGTVFASLSQRLAADFNTCITQGELEKAIGNAIIQANDTGVGRFWRDEEGNICGEIFNDYNENEASGQFSHAGGEQSTASAHGAFAHGYQAEASGTYAAAFGAGKSTADYSVSFVGGRASGVGSLAHGTNTAGGLYSVALNGGATDTGATGDYSLSTGYANTSSGKCSATFGWSNEASAVCAFAGGRMCKASADNAAAFGQDTKAASRNQFVIGTNNVVDTTNQYIFIVGNGSGNVSSNALTLDQSGSLQTAGDVTATNTGGNAISLVETAAAVAAAEKTAKNNDAITRSTLGASRKNLLKNTTGTTTQNGITFTRNEDGSVTCSGTATADTNYRYSVTLDAGASYTLTGCPTGGSTTTYNLFIMNTDGWNKIYRDLGSGKTFSTETHTGWQVIIRIAAGQTVDGLTFYPMLRYADIEDSTYETYTDDLQTQINALRAAIESLGGTVSAAEEG